MEHQDWDVIYTRGNKELNKKKEKEKETKKSNTIIKENKLEKKINEGNLKHDKVKLDISKQIQQKRLEMGMTQKDLANKLNVRASVIVDYENSKAIFNKGFIRRIEQILNCQLLSLSFSK